MLLKRKKTIICAVLAVLLLTAYTVTASAALDISYQLSPLSMNVKLPGNDLAVTRQTEKNSPIYEKLQLKAVQTQQQMEENDLYLMAFPADSSHEINIRMVVTDKSRQIHNLKFLSQQQLKSFEETLLKEQNSADCAVTETQQALFVNFETRTAAQGGDKTHTISAYTVVNGQQISLMLTSKGDNLSVEEAGIFHNMVESVMFDRLIEKPLDVNMGAILLITLITVFVLAAVCALIIFFRTKKRMRTNGEASFTPQKSSKAENLSPMDDFYDELEKDGLLSGQPSAQNITVDVIENEPRDEVFKNKPVRVELEITKEQQPPQEAEQTDAAVPQKPQKNTEEEKDSIELSRSNNEDYDEADTEDALHGGKIRIFVGGAGSKIKNSVSSVGGVLKYKPAETIKEKPVSQEHPQQQEKTKEPQPLKQQKAEQSQKQDAQNGERKIRNKTVQGENIAATFENDSYWDKYR